jgi:hypothetical protein
MLLIEIFKDHVLNKKSLKDYVELRKSIKERGEFNDEALTQAEDNLQRLKREDNAIYELMYATLQEYVKQDKGHTVEYPINFIREILQIYLNHKSGLEHPSHDA